MTIQKVDVLSSFPKIHILPYVETSTA